MEVKEYESGEYQVITMYHTGLAGQCIQSIQEKMEDMTVIAFPTEVIETEEQVDDVKIKKLTAYWNGDSTALEMDGKTTTFGMAVLAPGCDAGIQHTNKYTTDKR